jgi:NAD(P)-dependent dehydrogenase (short-subunit alcohol dehydrogenase family)
MNQASSSQDLVIVGAGSALGFALTEYNCQREHTGRVFALSRHPLAPVAAPRQPLWIPADAGAPASFATAAAQVAEHTATIGGLIICTGILHGGVENPRLRPEKNLGQLTLENLQTCMNLNAYAPLQALNAFSALLRHPGRSYAAALSAMVGSITDNQLGGWYSYRMSKAALNMGLRNAAIELGRHRHGPIVVAIHPGTTASPLAAPFAGTDRTRPADASARAIMAVLDAVTGTDTGRFFNWDGRELPW